MSTSAASTDTTSSHLTIQSPVATDASAVHALIARCPPLDHNSLYCNLLQCSDFADTCSIARLGGDVVGFVSGYRPPNERHVLFIWQVAVDAAARGRALARRLITDILARPACAGVTMLHTTVTPSNQASRAMFTRLAAELDAAVEVSPRFDRHIHLADHAESEELFAIGPFDRKLIAQEQEKS